VLTYLLKVSKYMNLCSRSSSYSLNCHVGTASVSYALQNNSLQKCRTESVSVMDYLLTVICLLCVFVIANVLTLSHALLPTRNKVLSCACFISPRYCNDA